MLSQDDSVENYEVIKVSQAQGGSEDNRIVARERGRTNGT